MRVVRWILIVAVTVLLLAAAAVLAVNGHDEPLSDTAQRLVALDDAASAPGNGAAALWAFDAPAGVDAGLVGRAVVAAVEGVPADAARRQDWAVQRPYAPAHFQIPLQLGCLDPGSACIRTALAHQDLVRRLAAEQAVRLERIRAMANAPSWEEIAPRPELGAPNPPIDELLSAFSLSLDWAAVQIAAGQIEEGIDTLETDLAAARRLVAHSRSALLRDTALGMMRRTYLAYSEILSESQADRPAVARLAVSLAQHARDLSPSERDLQPVLRDQALRTLKIDEALAHPAIPAGASFGSVLLLKATPLLFLSHATFNETARLLDLETPVLDAAPEPFIQALPALQQRFEGAARDLTERRAAALYNPLGRILASQTRPLFELVARESDVTALGRAVTAKATLMSQRVHFPDAAAALARLPAAMADPYTGRPFAWNAGDAAIVVSQHSGRGVTALAVPLT